MQLLQILAGRRLLALVLCVRRRRRKGRMEVGRGEGKVLRCVMSRQERRAWLGTGPLGARGGGQRERRRRRNRRSTKRKVSCNLKARSTVQLTITYIPSECMYVHVYQ